jgi:hypothetical protein
MTPYKTELSKIAYTYNGKECKPDVTIVDANGKTISADSYDITYRNNIDPGTAYADITLKGAYSGTFTKAFTIKKNNPMTVKTSNKSVKYANVKTKAQTVAPVTVKKAAGTVTYTGKGTNSKSKKALSINKKNGKITVRKGTAKGTYKMKVTVKAAGTATVKAKTVKKTVTIKVA